MGEGKPISNELNAERNEAIHRARNEAAEDGETGDTLAA